MTKSQDNYNCIDDFNQIHCFQTQIFTGFNYKNFSKITFLINDFISASDFSFFDKYYLSNDIIGGRPNYDYRILLKIFLYSLYNDISLNKIKSFHHLGSELHYLSIGLPSFPKSTIFSKFLNVLDNYIDVIFFHFLNYMNRHIDKLDFKNLLNDGTVFEAHNSRHKVVTKINIERSNKKWKKILDCNNSSDEDILLAQSKLNQNAIWTDKLDVLGRNSFGRTDEDCVLIKDKNGSYIAGYNVQVVVEGSYGLIVYPYISNKTPDAEAFKDIIDDVFIIFTPETITMDTGYGTPYIIGELLKNNIMPYTKSIVNNNTDKKINDYSFALSE